MANIFLTKKCNLKCPYCFADEFVNKDNEEITTENFLKALEFIKTDKDERVGFIGGEPTLHPEFKNFLQIVIDDKDIQNIILYTNGIEIDKYIDLLSNEKVHILINCNSPKDIGNSRFEKLKNNISLLKSVSKANFTLGLNLYSGALDYNFIFDLLKMIDAHHLRFSIALSNNTKEDTYDALDSYRNFKSSLFKFLQDCYDNQIVPQNDCNAIPNCLLNIEEKRLLLKLQQLSNELKLDRGTLQNYTCSPVIDILPDLNAVRCFGFSKNLKAPITNFKNIFYLRQYFINKIDVYAKVAHFTENCEDCRDRTLNRCGICFTYKLKKMNDIKEFSLKHLMSK